MPVYQFQHPKQHRIYFWDLDRQILFIDGHPEPFGNLCLKGALLQRFLEFGSLDVNGIPIEKPTFGGGDIAVRRYKYRLLKALNVAKEDRDAFIRNKHGAQYIWLPKVRKVESEVLQEAWRSGQTDEGSAHPERMRMDISTLPVSGVKRLIGRERDLQNLQRDYLSPSCSLSAVIGIGGVGKSTIAMQFINQICADETLRPDSLFGWSFYAQGTHQVLTHSGPFFLAALRFFGVDDIPMDDIERVHVLLNKISHIKVVLILDGLEPLQHSGNADDGLFQDQPMRLFLSGATRLGQQSRRLILATSRQRLSELVYLPTVRQFELGPLDDEEGVSLLRTFGLLGSRDSFFEAVRGYQGHPLSLTLLGNLISIQFHGDIGQWRLSPTLLLEDFGRSGRQAVRIFHHYWSIWENGTPQLVVLCLISLFDRVVQPSEWSALLSELPFAAPFARLNPRRQNSIISELSNMGLVTRHGFGLDAHPLVRSFFNLQFGRNFMADYSLAQEILGTHFLSVPAEEVPQSLRAMEPLYRAVFHFCQQGNYKRAYHVYRSRISAIDSGKIYHSCYQLGAFAQDAAALACFFPQGWSDLPTEGCSKLSPEEAEDVLAQAGFCLFSLSKLREASHVFETQLKLYEGKQETFAKPRIYHNLIEIYTVCGELQKALNHATSSVEISQPDPSAIMERVESCCAKGNVLMLLGDLKACAPLFKHAEQIEGRERYFSTPFLDGYAGYQLCEWLFYNNSDKSTFAHLLERCENGIRQGRKSHTPHLHEGLYQLIKARVLAQLGQDQAAVETLNKSDHLLRKYNSLETTAYYLVTAVQILMSLQSSDIQRMWTLTGEARTLIESFDMTLYRVDLNLIEADLYHREERRSAALTALAEAEKGITQTGYALRRPTCTRLKTIIRP